MRAKLNDVLSLMPYIPPVYHQFYNDIVADERSSRQTDDDDDLDLEKVQDDDVASEVGAGSQLNKPQMPKKRKSKTKQQI